jgi:hypothetical protein
MGTRGSKTMGSVTNVSALVGCTGAWSALRWPSCQFDITRWMLMTSSLDVKEYCRYRNLSISSEEDLRTSLLGDLSRSPGGH